MDSKQAARETARQAVAARMAELRLSLRGMSEATASPEESGIDTGTMGDFLVGKRWPRLETQGRIEQAIGWPVGSINAIARGGPVPAVGGSVQDQEATKGAGGREDTLLYQRPENVTDADWQRIKLRSRAYIEGLLDAAAEER